MTTVLQSHDPAVHRPTSLDEPTRANALADRLEQGPARLPTSRAPSPTRSGRPASPGTGARSASSCITSPACTRWRSSWRRRWPAASRSTGVTWDDVHEMNAEHAKENDAVTKEAALDLLRRNSAAAAAAIRALSDEELDRAAAGVAQRRCAAHVPVHARGSRRPAQLSPPGADTRGFAGVGRFSVTGFDECSRCRKEAAYDECCVVHAAVTSDRSSWVKARQQAMWASGDFAVIGATLQIVGELLNEAVGCSCDRAGARRGRRQRQRDAGGGPALRQRDVDRLRARAPRAWTTACGSGRIRQRHIRGGGRRGAAIPGCELRRRALHVRRHVRARP